MDEHKTNILFGVVELVLRYLGCKPYSKLTEEERQQFKDELFELFR